MKKNKKKGRDWFMLTFVITLGVIICGTLGMIILSQFGLFDL